MSINEEASKVVESEDCLILKSEGNGNRIKEEDNITTKNETSDENNDEVPSPPAVCLIKTTKQSKMSTLPSMKNLMDWTNKKFFFCGMRGPPDNDYVPSEESDLEFDHNTPTRKSPRLHAIKEDCEGGTTVPNNGGNENDKKMSKNGKKETKHNMHLDVESKEVDVDSIPGILKMLPFGTLYPYVA
jgi:hypothetical protein